MRERVARLERKAVGKAMLKRDEQSVIRALPDIVLEINRTVRICRLSRISGIGARGSTYPAAAYKTRCPKNQST